jgi:hypothetical protein
MSATWISTYGSASLHPDFGSSTGVFGSNPPQYWGYNFNTVAASTALVDMSSQFAYGDESDLGPPSPPYPTANAVGYPITSNMIYEGDTYGTTGIANISSSSGSDCHLFIWQPAYNLEYEIYAVSNGPGQTPAWAGGAIFVLSTNHMRPDGWTSSDASGAAVIPVLPAYDEATSANGIQHMLRMSFQHTHNTYDWPASHQAGVSSTSVPNMGAIWCLNPNYDISGFSPTNQRILQALKTYGAFVADNGGSGYLQGMQDSRWDDNDINNLKQVHVSDGFFRDVSSLKYAANSYAAGTGPASVSSVGTASSGGPDSSVGVVVQSHHRNSQPRAQFK